VEAVVHNTDQLKRRYLRDTGFKVILSMGYNRKMANTRGFMGLRSARTGFLGGLLSKFLVLNLK
jgi:hypothetical protein